MRPSELQRERQASGVWVSNFRVRSNNLYGFTCEAQERDINEFVSVMHRAVSGEAVPEGFPPDELWVNFEEDDQVARFPPFIRAGDLIVVSEKLADLLRGFDLAASRLRPVRLLHMDRTTPFPGTYFLLDLRETKRAFDPERSARWEPKMFEHQTHVGSMHGMPKDGDIAVRPSALEGADIWTDPDLLSSLFFSNRLLVALREAGMLKGVETYRCVAGEG